MKSATKKIVNKILIIHLLIPAFVINTKTFAATTSQHWYTGGFLGTSLKASGKTKIPSIDSKPPLTSEAVCGSGYMFGLNLGYKFAAPFRIETELAYQNLPIKKIDDAIGPGTVVETKNSATTITSLFINGYYDLRLFPKFTPYLGLGLGY